MIATISLLSAIGVTEAAEYRATLDVFRAQIAAGARTIVSLINCPGGVAGGFLAAGADIRALCDAAGVRWVVYCESVLASAAYGFACHAHDIAIAPEAAVGSIGVRTQWVDMTESDRRFGITVHSIASGSRKLDGDPSVSPTPEALESQQALINDLAGVFFASVMTQRPQSAAHQAEWSTARMFVGANALAVGLVDRVLTLGAYYDWLAAPPPNVIASVDAQQQETIVDDDEIIEALKAKAKAGDAKAAAALKAMEGEELPKDDEETPASEPAPEALGASAPAARSAAAPKAQPSAIPTAASVAEAASIAAERATYLKLRADLAPELLAVVRSGPIEAARAIMAASATPSAAASNPSLAAVSGVQLGSAKPEPVKSTWEDRFHAMNVVMCGGKRVPDWDGKPIEFVEVSAMRTPGVTVHRSVNRETV